MDLQHRRKAGQRAVVGACLVLLSGRVAAQPVQASVPAIRGALEAWMADFNARRADRICGLFSPDLHYDYRGFPERNYHDICNVLRRSLTDPTKRYQYTLEIKDIVASGALAVAHVVWTLRVTSNRAPAPTISREYSMDVFRRQTDGTWTIVRYGYPLV